MTDTRPASDVPRPALDVTARAHDNRAGMTLGELHAATSELLAVGASPDSPLKVTASMRGRLRTVAIEARS